MANRPVTFDDMIAFFAWMDSPWFFTPVVSMLEKRRWWMSQRQIGCGIEMDSEGILAEKQKQWQKNRLADGAGIPSGGTCGTTPAQPTTAQDPSDTPQNGSARSDVAGAGTSSPSAGGTASCAGSVAAAVEALRVALANERAEVPDVTVCADLRVLRHAIDDLRALDVPGRIAQAESDAANLLNELASAREAHRVTIATFGDVPKLREQLAAAQSVAKTWKLNFDLMANNADWAHAQLRIEREACDQMRENMWAAQRNGSVEACCNGVRSLQWMRAYDTRRAAEKQFKGGSDAGKPVTIAKPDGERPSPSTKLPVGNDGPADPTGGSESLAHKPRDAAGESPAAFSPAPPPTGEPEPDPVARLRKWIADGWESSTGPYGRMLAAYDAEVAHHARTTATLQSERAALTIERVRVVRIVAILSDTTLENPQAIARALRVAEGGA